MPTTLQDTSARSRELEDLGESLCRRIAAGDYGQARQIADRCVALDAPDTHYALLALLERARRLAILQRSLASQRLANLESATRYASTLDDAAHYIARG